MPVAQKPPVPGGEIAVSRSSLWGAILLLAASAAASGVIVRRFSQDPPPKRDRSSASGRRAVPPPSGLHPGLLGEYWELGREIVDFPVSVPESAVSFTRTDARIRFERAFENFAGAGLNDRFFVRWTGVLRIPRDGKYAFILESDDGARLFIDGRLVVDNGGRHEMREQQGDVELAAGDRDVRLEFFDDQGPAGCILSWEGPGIARETVPETALFHRRR